MKYKTGDKFIIEIDSVMTNRKGTLYGIKGLPTVVFSDYGLDVLERVDAEENDEFRVGDEVIDIIGTKAVVTSGVDNEGYFCALGASGDVYGWSINGSRKTGRHFDEVEKLLEKIKK